MLAKSDRNQQKQPQQNLSPQIQAVRFGLVIHHRLLQEVYCMNQQQIDAYNGVLILNGWWTSKK